MDIDKINKKYLWLKVTFFIPLFIMIGVVIGIIYTGASDEPKSIFETLFWLALVFNIAYLYFLGSLARLFGKSGFFWVFLTIIFSGAGVLISFILMMGNVARANKQQEEPS